MREREYETAYLMLLNQYTWRAASRTYESGEFVNHESLRVQIVGAELDRCAFGLQRTENQNHAPLYGMPVDIWSLACVAYGMFIGHILWRRQRYSYQEPEKVEAAIKVALLQSRQP